MATSHTSLPMCFGCNFPDYPAVGGFVDVVLSISHDAKHARYDPERKCCFQPHQRHLSLSCDQLKASGYLSLSPATNRRPPVIYGLGPRLIQGLKQS
ncbi:hypothetical protein RHGRI_010766 [Rhododendron griersonianum]|uniref:Uncharacterized protein n=1 Tax=Rhododendron griersonianum TaxID=479676 RepID=A0AAV6KJK0_9ERIC|nr:hypothetical protein RHGRI_010766 [Rhododendron griersonianum]